LLRRFSFLALLFALELVAITLWLDNVTLVGRHGLVGVVGQWGAWILRGTVGFAALFFTFAWLKREQAFEFSPPPVSWRFLALHLALVGSFGTLSSYLYGRNPSDVLAFAWLLTGTTAIGAGTLSFIPISVLTGIRRSTGYLWLWALSAVLMACVVGNSMRSLWPWTAFLTFQIARQLLSLFVPKVVSDPATMTLGTPRFFVEIAPECSGLEGVGLMLAFGILWLALFRKECRFPRALLLLPAGALLIFFLNSVRIAALILLGDAGAERIALGGFHSQAGWIVFNLVAFGFSIAAVQIPWIRTAEAIRAADAPPAAAGAFENPVAPWVLPFVAILAAGMIAHALSDSFEWLYPLRLIAAVAALIYFRRNYAALDWRMDWTAPAAGVVMFAIWIGIDRFLAAAPEAMPAELTAAAAPARLLWLAARVFAAVVTVPLAEELAFRGFLYRRVISADFETVSLGTFSWVALGLSSLAFGLLHGDRWFAGAVAGVVYGAVMVRRGRIGNAVVAHGTTNALVAVDVIAYRHWHLW
jgi:exosortase E/protease (VPEID-CTERM system)